MMPFGERFGTTWWGRLWIKGLEQLGDDSQLGELAGRLGIDPQQAAEMASQYLPSIVDRLTPNGEIPAGGDLLGHGVELLKGLFNR